MKMTDDLADQLRNKLRNIISGYKMNEDDAGWLEGMMAARLAADQQKGGGEAVAIVIPNAVGVELAWINPPSAGRPPVGTKLYATPQPSIPAPAQQDGKASGGEVDDAVVRTFIAAYAQAKADRIPKVYAAGQREERDVIVALRAVRSMLLTKERHPPHAEQETQG